MQPIDFLRRILPATGLYIIDRPRGKGFSHQVCESLEEALQYALLYDSQGVTAYHACAAYREPFVMGVKNGEPIQQVRVQRNVRAVKAFWTDLDIGPGNAAKYESQGDACEALAIFCDAAGLPLPMVVSSGYGIHVYWTLADEINPTQWGQTAASLKALSIALGLRADHVCTSDSARVLRPVGTYNRKDAFSPKPVEVISEGADLEYADFHRRVLVALAKLGVKPPDTIKTRETGQEKLNEQFAVTRDFPPCSAKKAADKCLQLARMRDTRGDIPEPYWYAGIQLMTHSIEGDELIHEWSKGYAGYSENETNQKIQQIRGQALGPTLCSTFEARNPGGCDTCPFKGKVSSPVQLGAEIKSAAPPQISVPAPTVLPGSLGAEPGVVPAPITLTLPNPPAPFTRRAPEEGGGIFVEEDGILHKIYEYDCFPTDILFDEAVGHEVFRMRHYLPQEGWMEHSIQSSLLAKPAEFEAALRDVHIQPLIRNRMVMYMDAYLRKVKLDTKVRRLFRSMGWKDNNSKFVLGDRMYLKEGEIIHAGSATRSASFLDGFREKGSLADWSAATQVFDLPGCEPHAFMLLTAFAAPLLQLCGRDGFTVSALGDTGIGKSTCGKMMASVYGYWKDTWIGQDSTVNARVERLGTYNSIPAYMDEITTIDPDVLRDLIYMIPTGKGRDVLTRTRETREGAKWQTILVTSSNDPLNAKLQEAKINPEAESMRLFEFEFPRSAAFLEYAGILHSYVEEHYGVAGGEFIRRLVMEQDRLRIEIPAEIERLEREFQMQKKERFWSQAAALTLIGGRLARQWGIIQFDPERIRPWLLQETRRMRGEVAANIVTPMTLLGEYLDAHVGERLVVTRLNEGMSASNARPTRGALSQRYEKDSGLLWITRSHIMHWLRKKHQNPNQIKKALYEAGILLNADDRKILGAGTDLSSGQQVPCWKIRADLPEIENSLKKVA